MPAAILFDLDGVLVHSTDAWFKVVVEACRIFGGGELTRAEFETTFGQGTRADIEEFGLQCTPVKLNRFYVENFPRFASSVRVDPDAIPLLDALAARAMPVAVVTNTVSSLLPLILRGAGLDSRVSVAVCADQVAHPKPAPDMLLRACAELGVEPNDAWMVGDSRFDRDAAKAAGVRFVGLGIPGDERIARLSRLLEVV